MRRLALLSCLMLSGCAAQTSPQSREYHALRIGANEITTKCLNGNPDYMPSRKEAKPLHKCASKIFDEIVLPNVQFPALAMKMKADGLDNVNLYSSGKISQDKYKTNAMRILSEYVASVDAISHQRNSDALARQQAASASLLNYGAQIQAIQAQQAIANEPTRTNCNTFGQSINCTTW